MHRLAAQNPVWIVTARNHKGKRMTEMTSLRQTDRRLARPRRPRMITRRAWAALQSGARWLYPVKKAEESSYALSIVERGGLPSRPMPRNWSSR
jgi:hypothetical protein